jgi:hypothetical protein
LPFSACPPLLAFLCLPFSARLSAHRFVLLAHLVFVLVFHL